MISIGNLADCWQVSGHRYRQVAAIVRTPPFPPDVLPSHDDPKYPDPVPHASSSPVCTPPLAPLPPPLPRVVPRAPRGVLIPQDLSPPVSRHNYFSSQEEEEEEEFKGSSVV